MYILSSPRIAASVEKRFVISLLVRDTLVCSDHFIYFFILFLCWWRGECHETKAMLSGVFLECLNERRLRSRQNIYFNEYSP